MKWLAWPLAMIASVPAGAEARAFKVVTFGTSITARGGWQEPLAAALSDCLARPVEIVKIGGPGQASDWGLANAERVGALKPDLVIVEFAINDADLRHWMGLDASRANTIALIRRLRRESPGARIMLMTTHPVSGWKWMQRPQLGQYYRQYREIAAAERIALIDGERGWLALPGSARENALPDGVHPLPAVFADAVVPEARKALGCK